MRPQDIAPSLFHADAADVKVGDLVVYSSPGSHKRVIRVTKVTGGGVMGVWKFQYPGSGRSPSDYAIGGTRLATQAEIEADREYARKHST